MALIDCYECGKQISDTAPACPNCGAPSRVLGRRQVGDRFKSSSKPARKVGFGLFIGILLAPFIFFWLLLRDGYTNRAKALGLCWLLVFIYGYFIPGNSTRGFLFSNVNSSKQISKLEMMEGKYPDSEVSYDDVNSEVGCKSKYSDQKKDDLFDSDFKNRWMKWSGVVVLAGADKASLNIDGVGSQDLQVSFLDEGAGYNLKKGERIVVRFLMTSVGGCFLPFSGNYAVINGERKYGKLGDYFREMRKKSEGPESPSPGEDINPLTYRFKGDTSKVQVGGSPSVMWTVQVTNLSDVGLANDFMLTLRSQNYDAYIVSSNGNNKVFVGPFSERDKAEQILHDVRRKNRFEGSVVRYEPEPAITK